MSSAFSHPSPISRLRADVQGMHAYAIQPSAGFIKLDAMENHHRLPLELQRALGERLGALAINRYPATRIDDLKAALARHAQVPQGCSLMLGNGSDELISLLALAVAKPLGASVALGEPATILAPVPGFVMYAMSAQFQALPFVGVDLLPNFELDVPAMLAAIAKHRPAVTYLACPNNPTANLWPAKDVDAVIAACAEAGGICVIDEAYTPFACESYANRMTQHSHVLVMRTMSKFGLAGVRIGYMFGPSALVDQIDKLRPPYNISVLNAECAIFALEHEPIYAEQAKTIRADRAALMQGLQQIVNLQAFPSQANMILVRVSGESTEPHGNADAAFAHLKSQKILVKNVSRIHPLLHNCLRLTVGSAEENAAMLAALARLPNP